MVIDLIVTKTDDGFTAEAPSIKGCESWAHEENDAIIKALDLVVFYLKLSDRSKITIDRARRLSNKTIYKLIFNKN